MKKIIFLNILGLLALGCGEQKKDGLASKKADLEKLRTEIASLQKKADQLQETILKANPEGGAKSKSVETMTIAMGDFSSYLTIEGKIDAESNTIATAKAPGVITNINVRSGQYVSRGQTLATLDANAMVQSKAPIEQQLSLAKTLYQKQKRLFDKGIGTEVQLLQVKTQMDATQKQLNAMDAQIAMYRITSPISGTIESIDVKIGQATSPGIPAFKVVNLRSLKVTAEVAESYSSKINKGDKVKIKLKDLGKEVDAKITFASKVIDPLNRTFKIEIRLPRIQGAKPNMLATLRIADYENDKAIAIPINAVQTTEEGSIVMLLDSTMNKLVAKKVDVTVGESSGTQMEITKGLSPGDQLIIVGNADLNDGQVVTLNNSEAVKPKKDE